jgi:hypothetical protein
LNLADYNLTVSGDFAKLLNENGIRGQVDVWKTGVDSELFNPAFKSHQMKLRMFNGNYSPKKTLLVSVGRLSPEKHFDFLLKILERNKNLFLCIVGGGPYRECLEPLFPKDQTHFMGFLQGEELAAVYASADFFVYASVSETFGQVYLEAMSCGTPIVAARGEQMKEFFQNGVHGYTWKPHDVESACKALSLAMKNRSQLSENCRSTALNHSWQNAALQIETIYSNLAKESSEKRLENSSVFNYLKQKCYGIYIIIRWLYLIVLVLTFMAPFMKVFKPTKDQSTSSVNFSKTQNRKLKAGLNRSSSRSSDSSSEFYDRELNQRSERNKYSANFVSSKLSENFSFILASTACLLAFYAAYCSNVLILKNLFEKLKATT